MYPKKKKRGRQREIPGDLHTWQTTCSMLPKILIVLFTIPA